jgi:hypothetical protein
LRITFVAKWLITFDFPITSSIVGTLLVKLVLSILRR